MKIIAQLCLIFVLFLLGYCVSSKQSTSESSKSKNSEVFELDNKCKEYVIQYLNSDSMIRCKYIGSIKKESNTINAIFQDTLISGPDDNGWFVSLNEKCEIIEIRKGGIKIEQNQ